VSIEDCDILIIGGGPAGLIVAREAARARRDLSIVLLERDDAVGTPVRCGEGVGSAGLSEFLAPVLDSADAATGSDGATSYAPWISRRITRVVFRSPNGSTVRVAEGDVGYILDRSRFEPAIAEQAAAAGAQIRTRVEATAMRREPNAWRVTVRSDAGAHDIRARIVVGADGVESAVGRWAGIDTRVRSRDMESCAQYVIDDVDIDAEAIVLHFGDRVAPGGYAWVFPKGQRSANVGLGVLGLRAENRSAVAWLDDYVEAHFPNAATTHRTVGGVIAAATIARTFADGLILCGDAAHMINPLSGGGIVNAMKAGRLAAETAVEAVRANDTSAARLETYHMRWMRLLGDDHVRFHQLKEALGRFDDGFYDRLAATVNRIPESRRTLRRIFGEALVRHPSLLPVVFKYFV
jgi:digeranylgeranylglycerophospholipid reductase